MKEPQFLCQITNLDIETPIIITYSEFEWDDEQKELIRVDKEHIYYEDKKGDTK